MGRCLSDVMNSVPTCTVNPASARCMSAIWEGWITTPGASRDWESASPITDYTKKVLHDTLILHMDGFNLPLFKVADVWTHLNTHTIMKSFLWPWLRPQVKETKSMNASLINHIHCNQWKQHFHLSSGSAVTLLSAQTMAHPTLSCSRLNPLNNKQLTCYLCCFFMFQNTF